jgi:hypothetical protein
VAFTAGETITLLLTHTRAHAIFGDLAVTYAVRPVDERRSRLLVKLRMRYPQRLPWSCMRLLLPWGDLLMMRKQLLTLKILAERSDAAARTSRQPPD